MLRSNGSPENKIDMQDITHTKAHKKSRKHFFKLGSFISLHSFGYKLMERLGNGSFGQVFKINFDQKTLSNYTHLNKLQWVVKKIPTNYASLKEATQEAKIQSKTHYTFQPYTKNQNLHIISEFLPGKTLEAYLSDGENFDFSKGIQIVYQLAEQLYQAHHHTLRGKPHIHGDVSDRNIMIDKDNDRLDAQLFDNGFSSEHNSDDPNKLFQFEQSKGIHLNSNDFPEEAREQHIYGYKTDVYMLGNIAQELLKNFPSPAVEFLAIRFIQRMRDKRYEVRPDSEEVLKFFLTLNKLNLYYTQANSSDITTEYALIAKLIIINYNLWHDDVPFSDFKKQTSWSALDFENNFYIARIIVDLFQEYAFNETLLQKLFHNFDRNLPSFLNDLIKHEAHRLTPNYLYWLTNELLQQQGSIDYSFLKNLQGKNTRKCEMAEKIIRNTLNQTHNPDQVTIYLEQLSKIGYLCPNAIYAKLGLFKNSSDMWRRIVSMHIERLHELKELNTQWENRVLQLDNAVRPS